jgi:hypothetical protein
MRKFNTHFFRREEREHPGQAMFRKVIDNGSPRSKQTFSTTR